MTNVKVVFADGKIGRCFQKEIDNANFLGKKIGEKIAGEALDLPGFELEVTGGSNKAGFPMRKDFPGSVRKRLLLTKGVGANIKRDGGRKKKSIMGNTISDQIAQINLKVTKYGTGNLHEVLGVEMKPTKKEAKEAEKKAKAEEAKKEVTPKVEEKVEEVKKEESLAEPVEEKTDELKPEDNQETNNPKNQEEVKETEKEVEELKK